MSVVLETFFCLYNVFIYLYLGLVGGEKTYKIEPPDPVSLSKKQLYYRDCKCMKKKLV